MSYVKMLEDSYDYLLVNKNASDIADLVAAKSRLAYLSQAVFGFIVTNQADAESMSDLALNLINTIRATEIPPSTIEKRYLLKLISNTPFFINNTRRINPHHDFRTLGNVVWCPTYQRIIEINKNISTPFVDGDELFHDLMIGMDDWDCFLDSIIEFAKKTQ